MTRSVALWCLLVLACWTLAVATSAAQEPGNDGAKPKAKLTPGGTYAGKIVDMEKGDVSFTFEVEFDIP